MVYQSCIGLSGTVQHHRCLEWYWYVAIMYWTWRVISGGLLEAPCTLSNQVFRGATRSFRGPGPLGPLVIRPLVMTAGEDEKDDWISWNYWLINTNLTLTYRNPWIKFVKTQKLLHKASPVRNWCISGPVRRHFHFVYISPVGVSRARIAMMTNWQWIYVYKIVILK